MNRTSRRTGDDGVSESIGFLLIFTMVMVGIGLVTLYGYPMLLQQQTSADEQIMEKNMIVLQNDMKSLAYKTVPYKETSMKIGGGSLTASDFMTTGPRFSIYDSTNTPFLPATQTGELLYYSTSAGGEISLQNGAVVMRNLAKPGSTMLAQPRWFYDSKTKTMVVNLIRIKSGETMSKTGIGTVQMELGEPYFASYTGAQIHNPVYVEYTPGSVQEDYSTAWDNYFNLGPLGPVTPTVSGSPPFTRKYQIPTVSTLVIKRTDVIIKSI